MDEEEGQEEGRSLVVTRSEVVVSAFPHHHRDTNSADAGVIEELIRRRAGYRVRGAWDDADRVKRRLWERYHVEVMDRDDPMATTWIPRRRPKRVAWFAVASAEDDDDVALSSRDYDDGPMPLMINTVDTPYYRKRYQETRDYLERWQSGHGADPPMFRLQKCDLLNLQNHPSVGAKGILMQGWKTILLPWLLLNERALVTNNDESHFVLVAEDDIRFPDAVTPEFLRRVCAHAFAAHPSLQVLSLGHAWSTLQKKDRNGGDDDLTTEAAAASTTDAEDSRDLLNFLRRKPVGIHGTTLLALRFPKGVVALQQALETTTTTTTTKLQHWDQFLFHSTLHDLPLAVSDPPLAGWTEVETSLTKSGSGHRRRGGGRLGHVPTTVTAERAVQWLQRRVVTEPSRDEGS